MTILFRPQGAFGWFSYTTSRDTIVRSLPTLIPTFQKDWGGFDHIRCFVWVPVETGTESMTFYCLKRNFLRFQYVIIESRDCYLKVVVIDKARHNILAP
ncbi:hypothetical protein [Pseudomonas putida]|uniref:Uncharacterized protein n=1 Tax=Pseudomonas putida TaxID=303 RepID=A0ABD7BPB4_PSEPU|nr:hypothetical protein [Pseudomonas putida]QOD01273.1 hypothetical protein ID616_32285 [Pseudomonas putida]